MFGLLGVVNKVITKVTFSISVCFLIHAGVLFVVGGRGVSGDPFKSIECYDLRSDRWFRVTEMSTKRRHVGVIAIKGN